MWNPQNKTNEYNKTETDSKIVTSGFQWEAILSDISNVCVVFFFQLA